MTGVPHAIASSGARPNGSDHRTGKKSASAAAYSRGSRARAIAAVEAHAPADAERADQLPQLAFVGRTPAADHVERDVRRQPCQRPDREVDALERREPAGVEEATAPRPGRDERERP
jgi:hypothetical protein